MRKVFWLLLYRALYPVNLAVYRASVYAARQFGIEITTTCTMSPGCARKRMVRTRIARLRKAVRAFVHFVSNGRLEGAKL